MSTPASYDPRAPPPERTTPTRDEKTAGLLAVAMVARNSSRKASSSAIAAELRGLLVLMGMVRQSLTQLEAKAYAQECCSVWRIIEKIKNPPDKKPAGKEQLAGG